MNERHTAKQITLRLCYSGLLIACTIVVSKFLSIQVSPTLKISFSFIPEAVTGMLLGPAYSLIVCASADLIGSILFPTGGAFFPGFTITAAVRGLIYGLCLYRYGVSRRMGGPRSCEEKGHQSVQITESVRSILRVLVCVVANNAICTVVLNSLWLSMITKLPMLGLLGARSLQALVQIPVQFIVIWLVSKGVERIVRRV